MIVFVQCTKKNALFVVFCSVFFLAHDVFVHLFSFLVQMRYLPPPQHRFRP